MPTTPLAPSRLNRSHPLFQGVTNAWLPLGPNIGGRQFWDIFDSNQAILTNGPTWRPTAYGAGVETGVAAFNAYVDLNNIGLNRGWSMFMAYTFRFDGTTSGSATETGILHSQGNSGVSFRQNATTLQLLKSHIASITSASVSVNAGEFHTAGFVITSNTVTLYYDGVSVASVSDSTNFSSGGTTTLGYDADASTPEYGRHTHLGAILWASRAITDADALRFHLAAQQRWRPLFGRRHLYQPASAAPAISYAVYPPPALPRLPTFPPLWLQQLPRPITFTSPSQQPATVTPQVLPPPTRPTLPNFGGLWLRNLPKTPMPLMSPPSRSSVDIQKYPPPVRLIFPLVPLVGLSETVPPSSVPAPPPNPPATPAQQSQPPPVGFILPNFGQVWLANLRETPMPAGPSVAPVPPGPPSIKSPSKPFFQRIPDNTDARRLARLTELLSISLNSLVGKGQLQQLGPADWQIVSGGFAAARPPLPTDDITIGASVGCTWIDQSGAAGYICISNGVGSAVWKRVTA